jgi:hypothetical protein
VEAIPGAGPLNEVVNFEVERLRRDVEGLIGQVNDLAHRLNQAIANLQSQLDDKVNAEARLQP